MATTIRRIQALPSVLVDKIAAGEVIEAPFSLIKELVENSLDARASQISVETKAAGMQLIRVEDDGHGIHPEDLPLCIERHATSKIQSLGDLEAILSYGFRGEALASIAAVSHLEIESRLKGERLGQKLECRGGELLESAPVSMKEGTRITVADLFYATPARRKFVKSERSENMRISAQMQRIAIARPEVGFSYRRDDKLHSSWPPCQNPRERISQIFPRKLDSHLLEIHYKKDSIGLSGFITDENYHRANREGQFLYVNGRPVEVANFSWLVKKAYGELLPPKAHPYYFLFLEIDPARVDVNVHPQKREVRLLDKSLLHNLVQEALSPVLRPRDPLAFSLPLGAALRSSLPNPSHNSNPIQNELLRPVLESGERSFPVPGPMKKHSAFETVLEDKDKKADSGALEGEVCFSSQLFFTQKDSSTDFHADSPQTKDGQLKAEAISGPGQQTALSSGTLGQKLHDSFIPKRHFGIIFGTYILAEGEDSFYLIDQHTAHERVNFEKKKRELKKCKNERQPLLTPIVLSCTMDEKERILAHAKELLDAGFLVEDFGPRDIAIRELPAYIEPGTEEEIFSHLIERILEGETGIRLYEEYAALRACKASIKKNEHVAGGVISAILEQLAACENPSRCPHGRPTMMKITRAELDRIFHRA